jgi:glutamate/tyrosine decarboxylase-like PLP-dependent enzyme
LELIGGRYTSAVGGPRREEIDEVLDLVAASARDYLKGLDERELRGSDVDERADGFAASLPAEGSGAVAAVEQLLRQGVEASVASSGPRFFHFVQGGVTPAALGADWTTSMLDQNAGLWVATPVGTRLAQLGVDWLKELFGLPQGWGGVLTTGATMANFAALAAARRWFGLRYDVDVDAAGFGRLPSVPVFSSGYIHASARKALGMAGIGRDRVRLLSRDGTGALDLDRLRSFLRGSDGPSIVIGNAGEVNAGHFDPIAEMADLADEHGAWLHVDGAFGLFAAVSPRTRHLVEGVDRAHSVIADGHKWLNVAYDCGFAFVRDPQMLTGVFSSSGGAAYLWGPADRRPPLDIGPEMSQRARGLAVWATLAAYGREGYREVVERHLDLAQRVADRVDEAPDLERLAEVPLNIVCFRYRPPDLDDEARLDDLNRRVGEAILEGGRVYVGTTVFDGKVAFRPAIVNWRTREEDVDLLVEVIRDLGRKAQKP